MSVWYCIPSARPAQDVIPVLAKWRERGYKIALYCDSREDGDAKEPDIGLWHANYQGYARSVNSLIRTVMLSDDAAQWFVTGGDDIHPDANHTAEEIAAQCSAYFHGLNRERGVDLSVGCEGIDTWGVMQPTGDRWGDKQGAYADRVCGSPWMGREFCRRIYGGRGPIWPEFTHMFEDEHLQQVALKLGILWQRRDLIHYHDHWVRRGNERGGFSSFEAMEKARPKHENQWATKQHWDESKAIFERLKAGGFKEAEDLLP